MKLKIKKLDPNAVIPTRAYPGDAGLDLYPFTVDEAYMRAKDENGNWGDVIFQYHISFGIAVEIPEGYVGKLYSRSSIYKTNCRLSNCVGIIDSGYRGELKAVFDVLMDAPNVLGVPDWDKPCAQLVIEKLPAVEVVEVDELSTSERGTGGYGSSDKIEKVNHEP